MSSSERSKKQPQPLQTPKATLRPKLLIVTSPDGLIETYSNCLLWVQHASRLTVDESLEALADRVVDLQLPHSHRSLFSASCMQWQGTHVERTPAQAESAFYDRMLFRMFEQARM